MILQGCSVLSFVLILSISGLASEPVQANQERVIYSFAGGADGKTPMAPLLQDAAGNLYGAAREGGLPCLCGIVFAITRDEKERVLYTFAAGGDGVNPNGGLVMDAAGNLYGTTYGGGDFGYGTVFKVSRLAVSSKGTETVLHSFAYSDGSNPLAGLVIDDKANLYGTTCCGGVFEWGEAFKVAPDGSTKVLHSFGSDGDGLFSWTGLLMVSGVLYGTTVGGGRDGSGTVFSMSKTGSESVLYSFVAGGNDGDSPQGELIRDRSGFLYGTTFYGGDNNQGTIFRIALDGSETVLHSFGSYDGESPSGSLLLDKDGNLYGTTVYGGSGTQCGSGRGCGTVFRLAADGALTTLYEFSGGVDGSNPSGGLTKAGSKGFYGTTSAGGASGNGTVFFVQN
jgi:uncharacterized repeat protein (TIGR03803 family)